MHVTMGIINGVGLGLQWGDDEEGGTVWILEIIILRFIFYPIQTE